METNNRKNNKIPNITMTVIFEGSALNRNEKIGGNIQSVKKLTVNGKEKTFLSKGAIRHYLFQTLIRAYKWKGAEIMKDGDVLQFDIQEDNILSCEELDVFGYMNTVFNQNRKSPLSITKAISLFPYAQDMALYANHDLVNRAKEQGDLEINTTPNPFNKEEHTSLYKLTFTIDSEILGKDKWIMNKYEIDRKNKIIKLYYNAKVKSNNSLEEEIGETNESNEIQLKIEDEEVVELKDKKSTKTNKNTSKNKKEREIKINYEKEEIDEDANFNSIFTVNNGKIKIKQLKNNNCLVLFELFDKQKIKRIKDILNAIQDGLMSHTSGESNTIIPLFMISGDVIVPSPVFHSFIDVKKSDDGNFEVIGIEDAVKNGWLEGNIYIKDCTRLKANIPLAFNKKNNWSEFLESVNLPKE